MKIAHIVSTYPPYYAGMGNVVFQMANELTERGHLVEVFTPQYYDRQEIRPVDSPLASEHAPEIVRQIHTVRRLAPSFQYGNAARLSSLERELAEFDLVHLHYPFFGTAGLVSRWKRQNPRKPLVITYHMDTRGGGWKGLFFQLYARHVLPKILVSADAILVSSLDYARVSDARGLLAERPKQWLELPFGVDTDRFAPRAKSAMLLERHGLDPNLPTLLFVGGMDVAHYFKGVSILLEAILLLKKNDLPVQAVLVGDGELRPDFERTALGFGLSSSVSFVGRVSDEVLPLYYNLADLFVLPSVSRAEAFGMVLLEAMASGVPVLASDLPGVRTVALDGGQVVSPGDPIELAESIMGYFIGNNKASFWRRETRRIVEEKYSWPAIINKLDQLYYQLYNKLVSS